SAASERTSRSRTAQAGQILLFMLTMLLGGMVLSNLAEEKGNKIIDIPKRKFDTGEEWMVAVAAVPAGGALVVHCGERHMTLKSQDLDQYVGSRGNRGAMLSRNYRKVDRLSTD
ncbi:MAG: DNA topoisomerase IV subunit A, partial [Pseudomonadota bacterium]